MPEATPEPGDRGADLVRLALAPPPVPAQVEADDKLAELVKAPPDEREPPARPKGERPLAVVPHHVVHPGLLGG